MGLYRHYGQLEKDNKELNLQLCGPNRVANIVIELDEIARRLQKVKRIRPNEITTLKLVVEIATNLLKYIEIENKEVGEK